MKRLWSFALACLLCMALTVTAFAADIDRFTDAVGLLTESENVALNNKLDSVSAHLHFDIAIVVVDTLDGWEVDDAADSIYDQYNFGYGADHDGVILLIAMDSRDWGITAKGFGKEALNVDAQNAISGQVVSMLGVGEYAEAFNIFVDGCEKMVADAQNGNVYKAPFDAAKRLGISVVISLLVALIVVGSMKSKLKTVHRKYEASDYVVPGSLTITNARERYLYRTMSRTAKPKNNGSSSSSGGSVSTHGKF